MHRTDKIMHQAETVIVHHEDGTQHPAPGVVTPGEPILIQYERLATFHEVYWITVIEETDEQVHRPLRLLVMLEQF